MATQPEDVEPKRSTKDQEKLLVELRERYRIATEAEHDNRSKALSDLKFVNIPGEQWDPNMRKERGQRPCYEYNKLRVNGKRVINEIRANRPQGKVRAVEGGDKEIADLYEGLCRNIANVSDFDTVMDQAAEYQVDAGMGAWRVITEYSHDSTFDQDIYIKPIKNPLCLYWDPSAQDALKRDAEYWLLTDRMSKSAFEAKYPKAQRDDFEMGEFDNAQDWEDEETVRVCEYWYREPYEKEIWLVQGPDGRTVTVDSESDEGALIEKGADGFQIVKRRTVKADKIMSCVASGRAILEGPTEWAADEFPFVVVFGEQKVVDGKDRWWGLHRFVRDAQQSFNVQRTAIDETIAQAPKAHYWATAKQAAGNTANWDEAHRKNFPYLVYNADPASPGPPQRMGGPEVPVALIQAAQMSAQDIRDTSGLHEASFGEEGGEKSGIALQRKQNQAQIVTYNFPDNMAKAAGRTWEIMIALIPNIYDASRELRIIGNDGEEEYKKVNQVVQDPATGEAIRVNDITTGKYDVTITTGPSFATQRQEAAEIYSQIFPAQSPLYPLVADLIAKSLDYPYSDQMAERLRMALPPQIQEQLNSDNPLPPDLAAQKAQIDQAAQQVQQHGQLVQAAAQEADQQKAEAEKAIAKLQTAMADLDTKKAQFDAQVEKAKFQLLQREMQIEQKGAETAMNGDREAHAAEVQKAVAGVHEMGAQMLQQMAQHMASLQPPQVIVPPAAPSPKVVRIHARRVNGNLVAEPEYEAPAMGAQQPPLTPPPQMAGAPPAG